MGADRRPTTRAAAPRTRYPHRPVSIRRKKAATRSRPAVTATMRPPRDREANTTVGARASSSDAHSAHIRLMRGRRTAGDSANTMPKSAGIRITIWIEVEPRSGGLPRRWWGGRLKPAREVMPTMPAGQTILAAWVLTKLVITATTIPTIAIIATAHKTCSMVTDPRCRPAAHRRRNTEDQF